MDKVVELGRLYKTKYKSLNFGEYLYPISMHYEYTEQMNLEMVVTSIQIDDGYENRIKDIYAKQILDYFELVEDG